MCQRDIRAENSQSLPQTSINPWRTHTHTHTKKKSKGIHHHWCTTHTHSHTDTQTHTHTRTHTMSCARQSKPDDRGTWMPPAPPPLVFHRPQQSEGWPVAYTPAHLLRRRPGGGGGGVRGLAAQAAPTSSDHVRQASPQNPLSYVHQLPGTGESFDNKILFEPPMACVTC